LCFCKTPVENWEYWYQPHEIEARREEDRLYNWYLNDKKSVAATKLSHNWSNRLTGG